MLLHLYYFHNNIYGYAWKVDPAKRGIDPKLKEPIDIKKIIKKRKKVIIYGDAQMSDSEFHSEMWPKGESRKYQDYGMAGDTCLRFIRKSSQSVVRLSPIFEKEWSTNDDSGMIEAAKAIIPMHDLTMGGVEDTVKELMKK